MFGTNLVTRGIISSSGDDAAGLATKGLLFIVPEVVYVPYIPYFTTKPLIHRRYYPTLRHANHDDVIFLSAKKITTPVKSTPAILGKRSWLKRK